MRISILKLSRMIAVMVAAVVVLTLAGAAVPAQAQTFTTLFDFNYTDGLNPRGQLVQASNGILYGTTGGDLVNSDGTIYELTPGGTLTTITNFGGAAGAVPYAGVIQATNRSLYGTTQDGGTNGDGTVFDITPGGTMTTLHEFDGTDGAEPVGRLFQASSGIFYGTTQFNGADGFGTIFTMTASGTVTTLHSFTGGADGANPYGGVVQGTDGNFYGTTQYGGNGYGVVFKITPAGTLTTLYSFQFNDPNGGQPRGELVQGANGDFYGTTYSYGANGGGTVYKVTTGGALTLVYTFCSQTSCTDGGMPFNGLIQGSDGNFYGTTEGGGINGGNGTVFKLTPAGTLTNLYSFTGGAGGSFPEGALVQDSNGTLYGTTVSGGTGGTGTVFSLFTGLGKFVSLAETSGKEGANIGILGQAFSNSSVVKFDGVSASAITRTGTTFITATVPADALTGKVTVTTGATTLTSSQIFRVTPTVPSFSPPSGPVGTLVTINGMGLTQATKVTFNKISASFTVVSDLEITATVPTGATTGKIVVTTKGGTATTATSFTVN
jgi:uncharacterized repeat protein (TIGR03803 family)